VIRSGYLGAHIAYYNRRTCRDGPHARRTGKKMAAGPRQKRFAAAFKVKELTA